MNQKDIIRQPAEKLHGRELAALRENDAGQKPGGWFLSPRAVREFILGSRRKPYRHQWQGQEVETIIERKFYGDDILADRVIVTLMSPRGLMLVGEPGTAKSMLSELLAAAISGQSTNTIQGTAGITEDQIKYSWNYARLLAEGPSEAALVPSPLYNGLKNGQLVRFEELTRCAPEVQDTLISIMSDKVIHIPELGESAGVLFAIKGFNVIATANTRDRGVHEMSSALKRRFNFETVAPIEDKKLEMELVKKETERQLDALDTKVEIPDNVVDLLVTTFQDLRVGKTEEGTIIDKPSTVMSTAEAVAVGVSAGLDACYLGQGPLRGEHIVRQLAGTVFKDNPDDMKKLKQYFDIVVKTRARKSKDWKSCYQARKYLKM